jgi:hypothetical protein
VGLVLLRVSLPDERPRRPLRAHETVLAPNEIRVAGPQELVVVSLGQERHDAKLERTAAKNAPSRTGVDAEMRERHLHCTAFRNDGDDRCAPRFPALQKLAQRRGVVCKQGNRRRACSRRFVSDRAPERCTLRRIEAVAPREKVGFAQQSTGAADEPRKKEIAFERRARVRRREGVMFHDPRFSAQVFEDDPQRAPRRLHHRVDVLIG